MYYNTYTYYESRGHDLHWPKTSYSHTHIQYKYSMCVCVLVHVCTLSTVCACILIHIYRKLMCVYMRSKMLGKHQNIFSISKKKLKSHTFKRRSTCAYPYTSNRRLRPDPSAQHIILLLSLFYYIPAIEGCLTNPVRNWVPSNM
jgi:hypothetical protein